MDIKFSNGVKGLDEAEALLRIARRLESTVRNEQVCQVLEHRAFEHLNSDPNAAARAGDLAAPRPSTVVSRFASTWHRYFGPSTQTLELSRQRSDALARAERAEHSSFEALAEMAEVGRERDQALKEVEQLRKCYGASDDANKL